MFASLFSMASKFNKGHQIESLGHELQRGLEIYGPDVQPLQHTLQREGQASPKKRSMPHIHMRCRFRKSCCLKFAECFLNYGLTAAPKKQSF